MFQIPVQCHMGNPHDKYDKQQATHKIKMRLKGHVENPQQFCILCYFYSSPRAVEWAARADQMKFFFFFFFNVFLFRTVRDTFLLKWNF